MGVERFGFVRIDVEGNVDVKEFSVFGRSREISG
jgi:hypothetical protein